jgi:hypothetical protein
MLKFTQQEFRSMQSDFVGVCLECGEHHSGVEGDASGIENALLMGLVVIKK